MRFRARRRPFVPELVGFTTSYFQSQRIGFASILVLMLIGLAGMLLVREQRSDAID